jgi:mannosyltransferase OCH1-like enzyme
MPILIPKTINYIWLGQKPMHPLMTKWREGWGSLHPGWDIKTWTESRSAPTRLTNGDGDMIDCIFPSLLDRCCNLSQKSNIWRYLILERLGGLYLDTDFEPLRNIEDLINDEEAFAGRSHGTPPATMPALPTPGLIGCTPHHPWLQDLVSDIPTRDPAISRSLGFSYFHEITERHPGVTLFEPDVFYSQHWEQPGHYKSPIPATAHAVHRWSSKWFPDSFRPLTVPGHGPKT